MPNLSRNEFRQECHCERCLRSNLYMDRLSRSWIPLTNGIQRAELRRPEDEEAGLLAMTLKVFEMSSTQKTSLVLRLPPHPPLSFFRKLLYRIKILHNRFGFVLPERQPMPRGIGIRLIDSRYAENGFTLVFADGGLHFLLFFFHCSPLVVQLLFCASGVYDPIYALTERPANRLQSEKASLF